LSCSFLVLAPDSHSAYGELVQKYFIAQGLACGQDLCIIDDNAERFVQECMWTPAAAPLLSGSGIADDEDDEKTSQRDDKIKIAWRYEQMKKFQTTVVSSSTSSEEEYCRVLDLTCRVPASIVEGAIASKRLICMSVGPGEKQSTTRIIRRIVQILKDEESTVVSKPLRICIPWLGSPHWGDLSSQDIMFFLHSLRALLREHPHACASISLPPHLSTDTWGGEGWTQKLGWLSDAAITLSAFTANPSLSATFPAHHGLLHIHTLPAPHTTLPPSDKYSTLRGLASSAASGGGGENNLAFKCMRKRLTFETLHLDLEGGVGDRRTTPSSNVIVLEAGMTQPEVSTIEQPLSQIAEAAVEVKLESPERSAVHFGTNDRDEDVNVKVKPKKKVAFRSDKSDLYDF